MPTVRSLTRTAPDWIGCDAMLLAVSEAFKVTLVSLIIWVVVFPVLVQGLIVYAIAQARGEKRQNDEFKRAHE
jgi:hypothetical protein